MAIEIRESIRHGKYSSDRVVEVDSLAAPDIALVLNTSPYRGPELRTEADPQVQRISQELTAKGVSDLGWADYVVVEHN